MSNNTDPFRVKVNRGNDSRNRANFNPTSESGISALTELLL